MKKFLFILCSLCLMPMICSAVDNAKVSMKIYGEGKIDNSSYAYIQTNDEYCKLRHFLDKAKEEEKLVVTKVIKDGKTQEWGYLSTKEVPVTEGTKQTTKNYKGCQNLSLCVVGKTTYKGESKTNHCWHAGKNNWESGSQIPECTDGKWTPNKDPKKQAVFVDKNTNNVLVDENFAPIKSIIIKPEKEHTYCLAYVCVDPSRKMTYGAPDGTCPSPSTTPTTPDTTPDTRPDVTPPAPSPAPREESPATQEQIENFRRRIQNILDNLED